MPEIKNKRFFQEDGSVVSRYEILKAIGVKKFFDSHIVKTKKVDLGDLALARDFVQEGITAVNPPVFATFFEHLIIAPDLGKRIVKSLNGKIKDLAENEIEFLLWLHDLGRLVNPAEFFRNDLVNDRLLSESGIHKDLIQKLPPLRTMLQIGKMLDCTPQQLGGSEALRVNQEKILSDYFDLLTPAQRVVFLADNLGKRDENGNLFDLQKFLQYLRSYQNNYPESSQWPSVDWAMERLPAGIIVSRAIVERTVSWLELLGVDLNKILFALQNYGPKFVIVGRHGDFLNPSGLIYNTDRVMRKYRKDIIHLSPKGREQWRDLGMLIQKRKFRVKEITTSPSARAIESGASLNTVIDLPKLERNDALDDVFMPGPVAEGMTMEEHQKLGGGMGYDVSRWGKYHHERPKQVIKRMDTVFWNEATHLKTGETGIIISHGDPIAWWIDHQIMGFTPDPKNLRNLIYPNKGDAIVAIIGPDGKWFCHYLLKDPSLIEGESY